MGGRNFSVRKLAANFGLAADAGEFLDVVYQARR